MWVPIILLRSMVSSIAEVGADRRDVATLSTMMCVYLCNVYTVYVCICSM